MPALLAFRNMLRAAAHDPLWALTAMIMGAIRGWWYVVGSILIAVIVGLVLFAVVSFGLDAIGMARTWLHAALNFAVVGVMLWLFGRLLVRPMIETFAAPADGETHGSARFATEREVAALAIGGAGLLVGRDPKSGKLLRYDGPAHLLTMAPTRTGKGVGTIVPNLLTADRSVICIDPKGENARIAGCARANFGKVFCLDPFGVAGQPSTAFNPLADLDPDGLDGAEDAATLADALVYDPPGEAGEAHWNEEAKALIGGIILYIAAEEPRERRTLATLREALTLAPAPPTVISANPTARPLASSRRRNATPISSIARA
jgi:type IV secretion system protein VirD4